MPNTPVNSIEDCKAYIEELYPSNTSLLFYGLVDDNRQTDYVGYTYRPIINSLSDLYYREMFSNAIKENDMRGVKDCINGPIYDNNNMYNFGYVYINSDTSFPFPNSRTREEDTEKPIYINYNNIESYGCVAITMAKNSHLVSSYAHTYTSDYAPPPFLHVDEHDFLRGEFPDELTLCYYNAAPPLLYASLMEFLYDYYCGTGDNSALTSSQKVLLNSDDIKSIFLTAFNYSLGVCGYKFSQMAQTEQYLSFFVDSDDSAIISRENLGNHIHKRFPMLPPNLLLWKFFKTFNIETIDKILSTYYLKQINKFDEDGRKAHVDHYNNLLGEINLNSEETETIVPISYLYDIIVNKNSHLDNYSSIFIEKYTNTIYICGVDMYCDENSIEYDGLKYAYGGIIKYMEKLECTKKYISLRNNLMEADKFCSEIIENMKEYRINNYENSIKSYEADISHYTDEIRNLKRQIFSLVSKISDIKNSMILSSKILDDPYYKLEGYGSVIEDIASKKYIEGYKLFKIPEFFNKGENIIYYDKDGNQCEELAKHYATYAIQTNELRTRNAITEKFHFLGKYVCLYKIYESGGKYLVELSDIRNVSRRIVLDGESEDGGRDHPHYNENICYGDFTEKVEICDLSELPTLVKHTLHFLQNCNVDDDYGYIMAYYPEVGDYRDEPVDELGMGLGFREALQSELYIDQDDDESKLSSLYKKDGPISSDKFRESNPDCGIGFRAINTALNINTLNLYDFLCNQLDPMFSDMDIDISESKHHDLHNYIRPSMLYISDDDINNDT